MKKSLFELAVGELEERSGDIRPSDIVLLSEPLRSALNHVIRLRRFSLTEFAGRLGFTREETQKIADLLVQRNLFETSRFSNEQEMYYQARLSATTRPLSRPPSDIWKKID